MNDHVPDRIIARERQAKVPDLTSVDFARRFSLPSSNVLPSLHNEPLTSTCRRMVPRGGTAPDIQWVGRDGGTQTQIGPGESKVVEERRPTGAGEVRVIVQPIQPVFYMPQQSMSTLFVSVFDRCVSSH